MDKYVQLMGRMPRMSESRALRVLANTPLMLDFSDAPLERHTPLPDVVWCEQPTSTQMRADDCKVDHATPKTRVLRQMRTED